MSNYQDVLNRVNEIIADAMSPVYQSRKIILDSLTPYRAIQDSIREMMRPYHELSDNIKSSIESTLTSKEFSEYLQHLENNHFIPTPSDLSRNNTYDFPENLYGLSPDDYVTVDESAVKEYKIPDDIAIPIGHNRIRIKTSDFIAILGIIVTIVISVLSAIPNYVKSNSEPEINQQQIDDAQNQILQFHTQMLCDLFHEIDLSSSSQKKSLQTLKDDIESIPDSE